MNDASYSKALSRRAAEGALTEGEIKSFLLNGGDIDEPGPNTGKTILHYAVEHGHLLIALDLIKYGADINIKDVLKNKTPLDYTNDPEQIRQLVEAFVTKKILKDYSLNEGDTITVDKIGDLEASISQHCKQINPPHEYKPREWHHLITDIVTNITNQLLPAELIELSQLGEQAEPIKMNKRDGRTKENFAET